MTGRWTRAAAGVVLAGAVAVAAAGCSDSDSQKASDAASKAASAASSAASSLASKGSDALASASAEARQKLDGVKNGVKAKDDVTLGTAATGSDGKVTVKVSARNTASSTKSFAVQVNFDDKNGKLQDVAVVTVKDVAAGSTGEATVQSNRKLSGDVHAVVNAALRY
ncbi:hypothetical protein [Streptomyces cellostaticus]|uniref:hypothetical protein n=1 Tax=Streptomyces TaxID=1883 RepID=UPI002025E232|nr:hypothetical protein [Streptomyces cellostaticus]